MNYAQQDIKRYEQVINDAFFNEREHKRELNRRRFKRYYYRNRARLNKERTEKRRAAKRLVCITEEV